MPDLVRHHVDALVFLSGYAFDGRELVYLSYVAATKDTRRYDRHEYRDEEFCKPLDAVLQLQCRVMIFAHSSPLYEQALHGWEVRELVNVGHAGHRRERICATFEIPQDLHGYAPMSASARECERIRRKASGWAYKFTQLPDLERLAVFAALIQSLDNKLDFAQNLIAGRVRGATV